MCSHLRFAWKCTKSSIVRAYCTLGYFADSIANHTAWPWPYARPVRFVHNQVILMHLNSDLYCFVFEFSFRVCRKWLHLWLHPPGAQTALPNSEVAMGKRSSRRWVVRYCYKCATVSCSDQRLFQKDIEEKKYCIALKFRTSKFSQIFSKLWIICEII